MASHLDRTESLALSDLEARRDRFEKQHTWLIGGMNVLHGGYEKFMNAVSLSDEKPVLTALGMFAGVSLAMAATQMLLPVSLMGAAGVVAGVGIGGITLPLLAIAGGDLALSHLEKKVSECNRRIKEQHVQPAVRHDDIPDNHGPMADIKPLRGSAAVFQPGDSRPGGIGAPKAAPAPAAPVTPEKPSV
jgi:hypothetical protein